MADTKPDEATQPERALPGAIAIKKDAEKGVENRAGDVRAKVVTALVSEELDRRAELLRKGLTKRDELARDLKKIKPTVSFDVVDGRELKRESLSREDKKKLDEATEKLVKIDSAIDGALSTHEFEKLKKIVG